MRRMELISIDRADFSTRYCIYTYSECECARRALKNARMCVVSSTCRSLSARAHRSTRSPTPPNVIEYVIDCKQIKFNKFMFCLFDNHNGNCTMRFW